MSAAESGRRPVTTISVPVDAAARLAGPGGDSTLAEWLDRVDAVVLSRPRPSAVTGAHRGADPSLLAAALIARHPEAGWIVEADLAREHPYNLARRVASLAALSAVGVGVLIEATASATAGAGAGAGAGGAEPAAIAADAAVLLQKLWQSWPADSVIADRAARRFVDPSRIRRVDHDGLFRVAGPLQLPVVREDQPVLLLREDGLRSDGLRSDGLLEDGLREDGRTEGGGTAAGVAEVLVSRSRPPADDGRIRLLEVDAAALRDRDDGDDVLLRGDPGDIVAVLRARAESGRLSEATAGATRVRDRLHARPPVERLLSAEVAFPTEKW